MRRPRSTKTLERVRAVLPWLSALTFAVAGILVARMVARLGPDAIGDALASIDRGRIARAALCTAASYLALTLLECLAIRSVTARRLGYLVVALASFCAISVGHVVGLPFLSSSVVRYRIYSRHGLDEADVARVLLFAGASIVLGLSGLASAVWLQPGNVARLAQIPASLVMAIGSATVLLIAVYVVWCARASRPARILRFRLPRPPANAALAQIGIGTLNYFFVASTLHALLGDGLRVSLLSFASFYALAHALGLLSHVPGGLGVLELTVLSALPGADTVGALIVFRLVYHVIPFVLGVLLYGAYELRRAHAVRHARSGRS